MLIFKIYWFELQVHFFIFYLQQRDLQISSNKKVRLIFCYDLSRLKNPVFVMIFNSSNQGLKVHFIWLRIFVSVGTHFLRTSMIVKCESILNHFFLFSHYRCIWCGKSRLTQKDKWWLFSRFSFDVNVYT
jgi:hypothetical protein